jgi:hypothetical protein
MICGWENPFFWGISGTVLLLLLLYLFRQRGQIFYTGALFLWDEELSESKTFSRLTKQKLPLSFYLEACALLLLACGAAGFFTSSPGDFPPAVVVLNNSYAMKGFPRQKGIKKIKHFLDRFPRRKVIWLKCGREVELLSRSDKNFNIEKFWDADDSFFDAEKALAYAGKNFPGAETILLTDRKPEHWLPGKSTLLCCGRAGGNIAVTNARIKEKKVLIEVASFSDTPVKVQLKANSALQNSFELAPGEKKVFKFLLSSPQKLLKFRIDAPGDPLDYDNEVCLLNIPLPPVTCQLGKDLSAFETKILSDVLKSTPDFFIVPEKGDIFITRFTPKRKEDAIITLYFHKGRSPRFTKQMPLFQKNEQLLEGLFNTALQWAFFPDLPLPGKVLVFSDRSRLLTLEKKMPLKYALHFNLAAAYSNIHLRPFWVGFFCNLAEFCRQNRPGPMKSQLQCGETLLCNVRSDAKELYWEKGTEKGIWQISAQQAQGIFYKPGLYTLSDGQNQWQTAVNPRITHISDVRKCLSYESYLDLKSLSKEASLTRWRSLFIIMALLLLAFDQYIHFRRGKR